MYRKLNLNKVAEVRESSVIYSHKFVGNNIMMCALLANCYDVSDLCYVVQCIMFLLCVHRLTPNCVFLT